MNRKLFAALMAGMFGAAVAAAPAMAQGRSDQSQSEEGSAQDPVSTNQGTYDSGTVSDPASAPASDGMGGAGSTTGTDADTGITAPSPVPMDDSGGAGASGAESDIESSDPGAMDQSDPATAQ